MTTPTLPPQPLDLTLEVRPAAPGTPAALELVILLDEAEAIDLALRIVGLIAAAKREARP